MRLAVLDLDGPILDVIERHYRCYRETLAELGYSALPREIYWEMKRRPLDTSQILAATGATQSAKEFDRMWLERIEEKEYLSLDRVQKGAMDTLKKWKELDIMLVLATMRRNDSNLFWQLERLGLRSMFSEVVVGPSIKAKAEGVAKKVREVDRRNIVWIGDTEADVRAARMLGVQVCVVDGGLRNMDYLCSLAPDFFADDVQAFYRANVGWE